MELELPPPLPELPPDPLPEPELFADCGRHEDFPSPPSVQYSVTPAAVTPLFGPLASQRIPSVTVEEFDCELELDDCGDCEDEDGEEFEVLFEETFTPFDHTNFLPDFTHVYS